MKVYRGYNGEYENYGSNSSWLWVTDEPWYAAEYNEGDYPRIVEFDMDEGIKCANVDEFYEVTNLDEDDCLEAMYNPEEEWIEMLRNERYQGYRLEHEDRTDYCVIDASILSNPHIIRYDKENDEIIYERKEYMPAKSKSQQRFFGMVDAVKKGELSPSKVGKKVKDAANSMTSKQVKDFASTKTSKLPEKVDENVVHLTESQLHNIIRESVERILKEVYKSNKLRNLIKQHGDVKYKNGISDLTDDDISDDPNIKKSDYDLHFQDGARVGLNMTPELRKRLKDADAKYDERHFNHRPDGAEEYVSGNHEADHLLNAFREHPQIDANGKHQIHPSFKMSSLGNGDGYGSWGGDEDLSSDYNIRKSTYDHAVDTFKMKNMTPQEKNDYLMNRNYPKENIANKKNDNLRDIPNTNWREKGRNRYWQRGKGYGEAPYER